MSNYTKTTDFEAKDSLPTGDSGKIIRGAEFETEFDAISTAIATKADTAGPTFTGTLTFETISDGTIGVTAFVDEDDMVSDSATLVPTQQSVKAYVDSQVTAQDLDFQADSGGALSIDLDSESLTFTGGTGIDTSGSGNAVTFAIDSTVATLTGTQTLTNKTLTAPTISGDLTTDGTIDGRDVATDGTKLDGIESGATADQTAAEIRTLVDSATDSNVFTDADHTKLDGIEANATADQTDAEIRAAVEAATDSNVFTDADHSKLDGIEASADVTDTANVTAAGALMDSEVTNLAQVKAFDSADYATAAQGSTADSAMQDLVDDTTPQLGGDLASNGNDILFADNDKAIFGAGSDLSIYHDGFNSYIDESGNGDIRIRSGNVYLDKYTGETMLHADADGAVTLYHDNSTKLATTATGIDVTGGIGATSDSTFTAASGDIYVTASTGSGSGRAGYRVDETANNGFEVAHDNADNAFFISRRSGSSTVVDALKIDRSTGDFSLFENTGTTPKLFWDASAERLGIGNSSPATALDVTGTVTADGLSIVGNTTGNAAFLYNSDSSANGTVLKLRSGNVGGTTDVLSIFDGNNNEQARFTASGRLGIGTSIPDTLVHLSATADAALRFEATDTTINSGQYYGRLEFEGNDAGTSAGGIRARIDALSTGQNGESALVFNTSGVGSDSDNEAMRIDSSGNVGIGGAPASGRSVHAQSSGFTEFIAEKTGTNTSAIMLAADSDKGSIFTRTTANDSTAVPMTFHTGNTERMRIDSSGNVGIGTGSPTDKLHVSGTASVFKQQNNVTNWTLGLDAADQSYKIKHNGTERLRIDSSGNLLVGKTSSDIGTNGFEATSSGITRITRTSATANTNPALIINRKSSDGPLVDLKKDGTTVGSIGTFSGFPYMYGGTGFLLSSTALRPADSDGSNSDADTDLGSSSSRFKDLYLSGGVVASASSGNSAHTFTATANNTRATLTTSAKTSGGVAIQGVLGSYGDASKVDIGTLSNHATAFITNNTERARLDASGNLLVGTTTQSGKVTIDNGGNTTGLNIFQTNTSINYVPLNIHNDRVAGGATAPMIRFQAGDFTDVGSIDSTITATTYNTSSDQRLKDNIVDAPSASNDIDAIQVRSFDWKADGSHQKYGMIAQELQSVAPEAVTGDADSDEMMGVDYSKLVPMLVKEIQSLRARVAQLEGA